MCCLKQEMDLKSPPQGPKPDISYSVSVSIIPWCSIDNLLRKIQDPRESESVGECFPSSVSIN